MTKFIYTMQKLIFIIFIFFLSNVVCAQNKDSLIKIPTQEKGLSTIIKSKISLDKENKLVKIYLYKNANVKKALAFDSSKEKAKLA